MNKIVFIKDGVRGQITAVDRVKEDSGTLKSIALYRYMHRHHDACYLVVGIVCSNYDEPSCIKPFGTVNGFTPVEYHQTVTRLRDVYDRIYIAKMRNATIPSNFDFTPTIHSHGALYRIEVAASRDGWINIQTTIGSLQEVIELAQTVPGVTKVNFRVKYGRYLECNLSTPDIVAFLICHGADFVR